MAAKKKFPYRIAVAACQGGCPKNTSQSCKYGCAWCGSCVAACRSGAIDLNENGSIDIDGEKCVACGSCVKACPQQIIHIRDCGNHVVVRCSNKDKGREAKEACTSSCIGCGICEKICTAEAIRVIDNCAVIDDAACLSCGMCIVKCPRHVLTDRRGILV